jgi:NAD-dependent SIR2 family protein deacetylase
MHSISRSSLPVVDMPKSFTPPKSSLTILPCDAEKLADLLRPGGVVCITGAGISTASGIPDYRGPNGSYSKGHVPVQHMEFLTNEEKRKRYWARSLIGYRYFDSRKPNTAHFALAALQKAGFVKGIVTQNVDTLHTKAGSSPVIDLHGTNDKVECQSCGAQQRCVCSQMLGAVACVCVRELVCVCVCVCG